MEKKRNVKIVRQESWRYIRIKPSWRRPRGKSSQMRRKMRGWPKIVSAGYGKWRKFRGLHPLGLKESLVHNSDDLKKLDPKNEVARIASTVGEKKRLEIISKAEELNLKILNPVRVEEESATEKEEIVEEAEVEEK
jgi:large subunit ribosomal protein L32e